MIKYIVKFKIIFLLQVFGILCMALASPAMKSGTHWFLFVATISFIGTLIWVFVYLLSIREALKLPIDWLLSVNIFIKIMSCKFKKYFEIFLKFKCIVIIKTCSRIGR